MLSAPGQDRGKLPILNDPGDILGWVTFFTTVPIYDEYEPGYLIYDPQQRGKGISTEPVKLLVRYKLPHQQLDRLRLAICPANEASRVLAVKCGFTHGATAHG